MMDIRSGPPAYAYILQLAIIYLRYKSAKKKKKEEKYKSKGKKELPLVCAIPQIYLQYFLIIYIYIYFVLYGFLTCHHKSR
jgi:hypothetical protein